MKAIVVCVPTPGRKDLQACFNVHTYILPRDHSLTTHHAGTQCCFGGYRRFLRLGSRGRGRHVRSGGHTYEYGGAEPLPTPAPRTLRTVIESLRCVEAVGIPFAGHKFAPLQAKWPGFDWYRYNGPELCHGTLI